MMSGTERRSERAFASPRQLGYAMPAEWEPHAGTIVSWPHNPNTWPGHLDSAEKFFVELIREIARDETVFVNVADERMREYAQRMLDQKGSMEGEIRWLMVPTNDAWCRDYGPTVVRRRGGSESLPPRLAVKWEYNAWGGKYPPFDLDNAAALSIAKALDIPIVAGGMRLEGGAIDVNGNGWLMTTASCLLHPNRNPGLTREDAEHNLREMLGIDEFLGLQGEIEGDDTDGHIDNLARFVGSAHVVMVYAESLDDPHGFDANRHLLENWRSRRGEPLRVDLLPVPAPVYDRDNRLPASYANFLITNGSVLVPQYQCPADDQACQILAGCFPSRRIRGIDCTGAIRGLGAIHCLTQQVPIGFSHPGECGTK
jgi:agmatine deiminase